jgi:hypothetical protein
VSLTESATPSRSPSTLARALAPRIRHERVANATNTSSRPGVEVVVAPAGTSPPSVSSSPSTDAASSSAASTRAGPSDDVMVRATSHSSPASATVVPHWRSLSASVTASRPSRMMSS